MHWVRRVLQPRKRDDKYRFKDMWSEDIRKHAYGELSYAVARGDMDKQDSSQVEIGYNVIYAGIYDGHGCAMAASHVCNSLVDHMISIAKSQAGRFNEKLFEDAFAATEDGFVSGSIGDLYLKYAEFATDRLGSRPAISTFAIPWIRLWDLISSEEAVDLIERNRQRSGTVPMYDDIPVVVMFIDRRLFKGGSNSSVEDVSLKPFVDPVPSTFLELVQESRKQPKDPREACNFGGGSASGFGGGSASGFGGDDPS
ncbi:hypothetical protein L2E82_12489 [Cichorium intybus]|uniref:Uncharacterized protein n=1 Tax=Cichorium intybus TaxID=13427 RepID=A0ACB9GI69_CICIN|nr:hypothetical protein L2E82_12489 [Cichorium intybus]